MWSKLQKQLYNVMDLSTGFQMHCSVYKIKSAWTAGQDKHNKSKTKEVIPRYWITIGKGKNKEIIWDFPNDFLKNPSLVDNSLFKIDDENTIQDRMFWSENYTWVPLVIREYINTPREKLLSISFSQDKYNLVNTLRKYDRRIAKEIRNKL